MLQTKIYSCASGPQLIFSCSGAADVGELADHVARKLTREGTGKMFCTAGIGGGISGIIEATKSAEKIIALDGCALGCAKFLLEKGGFANIDHVCLSDLGFIKGQTALNEENIGKVSDVVKEKLTKVRCIDEKVSRSMAGKSCSTILTIQQINVEPPWLLRDQKYQ